MKINFKIIIAIAVATISLCSQVKAQFFANPAGFNWNIGASTPADRVNIGTGVIFPSALFIDGANLSSSNTGEVFRTDAPAINGFDEYWRMLHGGTGIFNLYNIYNDHNTIFEAVQNDGALIFNTSINRERMRINGTAGSTKLRGYGKNNEVN